MRAIIALLLFLALLSAGAQTTPSALSLRNLKEADGVGAHLYNDSGATGLVLVVVRDREVFFQGYGETAPGSHQLPRRDSIIRLCSLTKTFTADLLARLVADHTVALNDPLQRYAPPNRIVPQRDGQITLLELATHTAGLPREIGFPSHAVPHFTFPDYGTRWDWLANEHLLQTPGTVALYSNVGFDFLADALADAAHRPYASLLASRMLTPLHMWQTTYFPDPAQCARLLKGANDEGPCTSTDNTMGSSGLYSTPDDVAKWLDYLLGTGGPSDPAQRAEARAVYLVASQLVRERGLDHAGAPDGIGLAWIHLGAANDHNHIIEKTGGGAGFLTYVAIHPASHTALFLAATDGQPGAGTPGFNLFKAANNGLLQLAGLPLIQDEFQDPHAGAHFVRAARRTRSHKAVATRPAGSKMRNTSGTSAAHSGSKHRHAPTM
jgi:serine-type D-Ala-D-Ala carboxypeptidase/endopeptidase